MILFSKFQNLKKLGYSPLKNSDEQSGAVLALMFVCRCCLVPLKAQIVGKHGQLELGSAGLTVICTLTPKQDGFKTLVKVWHHEMVNLIEDFIKDNIKETYINLDDEPEVWTRLLQAAKLEGNSTLFSRFEL